MPRRRRVPKVKTKFEYSDVHGLYLLTGHDYFNDHPFGDPPDEDLMREMWEAHRDELMAERGPGRRPWAWWQFEAPEPRRRVGGVGTSILHPAGHNGSGVPSLYGDDYDTTNPPTYETEREFLERLNLLLPGESTLMGGE